MTEDEAFERRLDNWGRWMRDAHASGTTTCTAIDLIPEDERWRDPGRKAIDVKDAERVNEAWKSLEFTLDTLRKVKALIALLYTYPGRGFDFYRCRLFSTYRLKIRPRDFELLKRAGKLALKKAVERLDKGAAIDKLTAES